MNNQLYPNKHNNLISDFLIFSIIIFTIFYNLGAGIPLLFDINPSISNFTFKILGTLLFISCILYSISIRGIIMLKSLLPIVIFWLIYSIRLIYDLEIVHIESGFNKNVLYSYAFGGDLISIYALMFTAYLLNIKRLLNLFFIVAILSNLIIILLIVSKNASIDISLFFKRSEFSTTNSSDDISIINPITIGQNGGILIILSFYYLVNYKKYLKNKVLQNITYFSLFSLGAINLFLGASRGPTLFLIVILLLVIIFNLYINKNKVLKLIKFIVIMALTIISLVIFFKNNTSDEIILLNRFIDIKETASNVTQDERGLIFHTAWNQFVNNPILGDKFVESTSKWYPHNIILESLMATGIIGTSLFLIYIITFLISFLKFYRNYELLLIYFIGLYYFLCSLTSASLWNSIEIWIFPVISIYFSKRTDEYNLIKHNEKLIKNTN